MAAKGKIRMVLLFGAVAILAGQTAMADSLKCRFNKECEVGKRCRSSDYRADFIRDKSGKSYSVSSDGAIEAFGVTSDTNGKMGTLVAMGPWAISPYAPAFVLSFSRAGAILTVTELDADDTPSAFIYLGKCRRVD